MQVRVLGWHTEIPRYPVNGWYAGAQEHVGKAKTEPEEKAERADFERLKKKYGY